MRTKTFRNTVGVGAIATSLLCGVAVSAPAQAATDTSAAEAAGYVPGNPYNVKNTCGGDYRVIKKLSWTSATTFLAWNGVHTCAVTIKKTKVGVRSNVGVYLTQIGDVMPRDDMEYGRFRYFAGPTFEKGKRCRAFGGTTGAAANPFRWTHKGSTAC